MRPYLEEFDTNPRNYALALADEGLVDSDTLLVSCLKWMSWSDVKFMLIENELSPDYLWPEDDDG